MNRSLLFAASMLLVGCLLSGCGRDNGLSQDLAGHLAARGISITPSRIHAPLSQRGGYVVLRHDAQLAARIVTAFNLQPVGANDAAWSRTIDLSGAKVTVKEVWGLAGRPLQFKLKTGGQFEYVYLAVTADGEMYVCAEYAYG